jgi:hypothetical protein
MKNALGLPAQHNTRQNENFLLDQKASIRLIPIAVIKITFFIYDHSHRNNNNVISMTGVTDMLSSLPQGSSSNNISILLPRDFKAISISSLNPPDLIKA